LAHTARSYIKSIRSKIDAHSEETWHESKNSHRENRSADMVETICQKLWSRGDIPVKGFHGDKEDLA